MTLILMTILFSKSVIPIAFTVYQEHPDTVKALNEHLKTAIDQTEGHAGRGCISLACFGAAILSQFNTLLGLVDRKIGEFGVTHIIEFIFQILEVLKILITITKS